MKIQTKIVAVILLVIVAFYTARIFSLREFAEQSKFQIISQLHEAQKAIESLNPSGAKKPLKGINDEVLDFRNELKKFGVLKVAGFWDEITDGLKGLPGVVADVSGISDTAIHINDDLEFLRANGMMLLLSDDGNKLLSKIDSLGAKLNTLNLYTQNILANQKAVDDKTKAQLEKFNSDLKITSQSVSALYNFLNPKEPEHLLVLFQNESELRPAGGFIGSYADLTIHKGSIKNIEIRDIYDPDGQLDVKVVPPKPLQRLTRDWEARDANWFFDYPTSAKQVISFLNQSKIYSEKEITFSGAIAINTKVLSSIISLIEPLHLSKYNTTLTSETFLSELQREVESGENKKINQPKKILQTLAPILIEKFKNLDEEKKKELLDDLRYHFAHKNIMFYVDNQQLQNKLESLEIAGNVTLTAYSSNILNDYLAVVSANMAGGKSDYVTRQSITLESSFNASGTLIHSLNIKRTHSGENEKDWWYKANNKTYTQVYLPIGSKINDATGMLPLPKDAGWDYTGYKVDPLVAEIEKTKRIFADQNLERFIAFGKTVFAGWITTPAGKISEFNISYKNPRRFDLRTEKYELVFQKQSGANTSLSIKIKSPAGYIWQETGTDTLSYESEDPTGEVNLVGTFKVL